MRRPATLVVGTCLTLFASIVPATQAAAQPSPPAAPDGSPEASPDAPYVPDEVLVRFEPGSSAQSQRSAVADAHARVKETLPIPRVKLLSLSNAKNDRAAVPNAIAKLESNPAVTYAEPNYLYQAASAVAPNDPMYPLLWGLNNTGQTVDGVAGVADADIDAPEAWATTVGNPNVLVAVVDTGVAAEHPDLAGNMWTNPNETAGNSVDDDSNGFIDDVEGWDFVESDNDPADMNDHGTHVAGTIAATGDDNFGVVGVARETTIMPLRVLNAAGSGTNSAIASAFSYAAANGADVVNASLGGGGFSSTMSNAISNATGTLFVVAAGNANSDNESAPTYPCNYTAANLLCVAATTQSDNYASFSNWGSTSVDVAAPGNDILSSVPVFQEVWFDDMLSMTGWSTGGVNNTWGTELGEYLSDSPNTVYQPNTNSWARHDTPVDLTNTGTQSCMFDINAFLRLEPGFDFLHMELSHDATTWVTQRSLDIYDPDAYRLEAFDIDPEWFSDSSVYVRFRLTSDSSVQRDGVYIDDAAIDCAASPATYSQEASHDFFNGTSMATPHVAGVAALAFAAKPSATVAEVRAAITSTVDPLPAGTTASKPTVTNGRVNANAVVDLLASPKCPGFESDPRNQVVGDGTPQTLNGTGGADIICGLGGIDTINGLGGADLLLGGDGNDTLAGGEGVDNEDGGDGNDLFKQDSAANGGDSLTGGAGTDTVGYGSRSTTITVTLDAVSDDGATGEGDKVAADIENVNTGSGSDNVTGSGEANNIVTNAGVDTIDAAGGNDTINGGAGNDTETGGDGTDLFFQEAGSNGADTMVGGNGTDTVGYGQRTTTVTVTLDGTTTGNDGATSEGDKADVENANGGTVGDTLTGDGGANDLRGNGGVDTLNGMGGADTLFGGAGGDGENGGEGNDLFYQEAAANGSDQFSGGNGVDTLGYGQRTTTVTVTLNDATANDGATGEGDNAAADVENVNTGSAGDNITGNGLANDIRTSGGIDTINGLGAGDFLVGGAGNDTMNGGDGNDFFPQEEASNGGDTVTGGDGVDTVGYGARTTTVTVTLNDATANDGVSGEGDNLASDIENVNGGSAGDNITGNDLANDLRGGGGVDTLTALGGADFLVGGAGNDNELGGEGADFFAQEGASNGADTLDGGNGVDTIGYGSRTTTITVTLADGLANDGAASEGDTATATIENVNGGSVGDNITGNSLDNVLNGNGGNDTLNGAEGNDTLNGGDGTDTCDGGTGTNTLTSCESGGGGIS